MRTFYFRLGVKLDGSMYYEHVPLHAEDDELLSENTESILRHEIRKYFELKAEPIVPHKNYLSGSSHKVVPKISRCFSFHFVTAFESHG